MSASRVSEPVRRWQAAVLLFTCLLTLAALALLAASTARAQAWVERGHAPATGGQVENITDSVVAGAIEAIVTHPMHPDVIWVGSVNGGVFKTINATLAAPVWVPLTDGYGSLSIGALDLDPMDGTYDTLLAGVGRTSSFRGEGGEHIGLLLTDDGGSSWTVLSELSGLNISGVAARGEVLVAAAAAADDSHPAKAPGIWRRADGESAFERLSNDGVSGLPDGRAVDLVGDPANPATLYTIIHDPDTLSNNGIYQSTDTGATWTLLSTASQNSKIQLSPGVSDSPIARGSELAAGPNGVLYAAVCRAGGDPEKADDRLERLYRYLPATGWESLLPLPATTEDLIDYGIHPGGQCFVHLSLAVDPSNELVVYIGGDVQPPPSSAGFTIGGPPNSIGAHLPTGRLFRVEAPPVELNELTIFFPFF